MATKGRFLLLMTLLGLVACSPKPAVPDGFAPYKARGVVKAVSPEGVMYRVRETPNKPEANLEFWKEALVTRQKRAGYKVVKEGDIEAGKLKGGLLELQAPMGAQDYTYLLAIFVKGDTLIVVESAGEVKLFETHRKAILDAISKLPQGS